MSPEIDKILERAVADGVPPLEVGRQLIAQGVPESLVSSMVDAWMVSHGRKRQSTDFTTFVKSVKAKSSMAILLVTSFGVLGAIVTLLKPWPTKIMVDSVFGKVIAPGPLAGLSQTPKLILVTSILTLLIFVSSSLLSVVRDYLLLKFSYGINTSFKRDSLRHLLYIPVGRGLLSKGDYIYRQNVLTNSLADYILGSASVIIQSVSMIVAITILMFIMNFKLALICLLLIPTLYFLTKLFAPKVGFYAKQLAKNNSKLSAIVTESVDNAETIQAYEMAEDQVGRAERLWHENFRLTSGGLVSSRIYKMSNSFFVIVTTAVIMYYGGVLALNGEITLGELLIFMTYLGYMMPPVQNLANQLSIKTQKKLDVVRAHEVLSEQEGVEFTWDDRHFPISQGRITLQGVGYSYKNFPVFNNINLVIEPKQKIGIVGPSGSGKSTLLKLLPLFFEPSTGTISIDNIDIQTTSLKELRRQISYVSQTPQLFNISILENIVGGNLGRQISREQLHKITVDTGVYDLTRKMPDGLNTIAGEGGSRLSGGQKQKIALARGLAKQSPIICLDEPTSALDGDSENYIKEHIASHFAEKTVILVSHKKPLLTLMDKVYVLQDGTLQDAKNFGGLEQYLNSINDKDMQITAEKAKIEEAQIAEKIRQEEEQAKRDEKNTQAIMAEKRINTNLEELSDEVTVTISH